MKPPLKDLTAACPLVDERLVARHLEKLGDDYFQAFPPKTIARHLQAISRLSPENPVHVIWNLHHDNRVECTVVAFDYPGEFSLITGTLAAFGLNVLSGQIFTYAASSLSPPAPRNKPGPHKTQRLPAPYNRRCIIDYFSGTHDARFDQGDWSEQLADRLKQVLRLRESDSDSDIVRARHIVNEMVANRLGKLKMKTPDVLYPVEIRIVNGRGPYTTIHVISQDTPAFLYSLSNAMALRNITIERVRIQTVRGTITDEIDILDAHGQRILDPEAQDRIRFSVLLTKQFTYFLSKAADPYAALSRFDHLVEEVHRLPDCGQWVELFQDVHAMRNLAQILGTSDFLWEEFVRSQYETLLPMLRKPSRSPRIRFTSTDMQRRRRKALAGARNYEDKLRALNEWKDRESFLIDLDHILHAGGDVRALAEPLTRLAEIVIDYVRKTAFKKLAAKFGVPRTVGRLPVPYAVFGLGKFGGAAMGYASDIELLFVFSDNGTTDGKVPVDNAEFFSHLAEEIARQITSKREGIFRVDLRLRPYGNSGPKACSLETFCRYYGASGAAHSVEKLALTRLRQVAGDPDLGKKVQRLRDEFVYDDSSIKTAELQQLRERQFQEKVKDRRYNAKFSPGALVDLEYCAQILQVMHGKDHPELRTPRLHEALQALSGLGVVDGRQSASLTAAYYFLRRLINGLRMLRGHALDLSLPEEGSDEYGHLARRMGYERNERLTPEQQLLIDFETHTATIRKFIVEYFGRDRMPASRQGNIADLLLSDDVPPPIRHDVLKRIGFADSDRAYVNLRKLVSRVDEPEHFTKLAILASDALRRSPDPDMALNNWEQFVRALPDAAAHYELLLSQPSRIEILLSIFAESQFMADALVRNPEFLDWVTDPEVLQGKRDRDLLQADLEQFTSANRDSQDKWNNDQDKWNNDLRRFHRREILRIGTRDICLRWPTREIMTDLSALAEVITDVSLAHIWEHLSERHSRRHLKAFREHFCILALGKLGGSELNYSSDIDLLAAYDDSIREITGESPQIVYAKVMDELHRTLSSHSEEGYAYRVDLRLRPHGASGELVSGVAALTDYYRHRAEPWEVQACLKARPIAGNLAVGRQFVRNLRSVIMRPRPHDLIVRSIHHMRDRAVQQAAAHSPTTDVKTGLGGIRDVEFLVQGLQLMHLPEHPDLLTGHTLTALEILDREELLPSDVVAALRRDYLFLRRVEHCLQLFENRQVHSLPKDPLQLQALSKRILGPDASARDFTEEIQRTQTRIHQAYTQHLS